MNVEVAVKEVWFPPAASEAEHRERLTRATREARHAARLRDHPHIVAVHDVVVEAEAPWTVMRLVDGISLDEHLRTEGRLPAAAVADLADALLQALGAAHAAGIVHRDVKPANIMLASNGQVLLTDFGISVHRTDTALTGTGGVIGSVEYMAPERLNGVEDRESGDLFSLGVTLYQAVEGVSPFKRPTPTATLAAVVLDEAPPPLHAGPLAPLIAALLAKDPEARPSTGAALAKLRGTAPTAAARARTTLRTGTDGSGDSSATSAESGFTITVTNESDQASLRVFVDSDVLLGGVEVGETKTLQIPPGKNLREVRVRAGQYRSASRDVGAGSEETRRLVARRTGQSLLLMTQHSASAGLGWPIGVIIAGIAATVWILGNLGPTPIDKWDDFASTATVAAIPSLMVAGGLNTALATRVPKSVATGIPTLVFLAVLAVLLNFLI